MSIEQEALMVLRKIAEGSDFAALFPAAGEDARKVESELRRLQGEVKRLEQESAGDAPCGHPARLFAEQLGKKFCVCCEWEKTNTAYIGALSRAKLADEKRVSEVVKRDAAERDALHLRRKVKKLKRKLRGEPEKKRTPEEERLMQYIKTGDKTWMASAPGTSPGSHLAAGEPPEHFNHRCKVVEEPERTPEEKQTEPLKPCPFCESESAEVRPSKISSGFYVVCTNCGSDTRTFRTRSEAIAMWNKRSRRVAPPTPEQSGEYLESQGYTPKIAPRPGDALNPPSSGSNVYRPEAKPETALDINTMVIQATRDRAEIEYLRAALEKIACLGNYGDKPPYTHMIAAWGEWQPVWDFARGALDKKQAEPKAVRTTIKVDGVREAYEKLEDIKADMIASGAVERMIKSEIEKGFGGFKDINGGTVRYLEAKVFARKSGAIRITQDLRNRKIKINDWMESDEFKDIAAAIERAAEAGYLKGVG